MKKDESPAAGEKPKAEKPKDRPEVPFSPIVDEKRLGRFEHLYRRMHISARLAHVFVTRAGECVVFPPSRQPTTGQLVWSGFRTMYAVDLGLHFTQVREKLPSVGDTFAFNATVDLAWHVDDPRLVVLEGVTDVRKALSPTMLSRLREATRKHAIDFSEAAEREANAALADETLGKEIGLAVKAFVRLTPDDVILEQAVRTRQVDHFREIIARGDLERFALRLATTPEAAGSIVQDLFIVKGAHRKEVFDFISRLLESDALDRWQIDDQVRATLRQVQESGWLVLSNTDGTLTPPWQSGNGHKDVPWS
jgi:hypothetical protein